MMDVLKKNKKLTIGLIISVVCVVLTALIVFLSLSHNSGETFKYIPISFDDVTEHKYKRAERGFNGSWYSEDQILWKDKLSGDLVLYNTTELKTRILIKKEILDSRNQSYFVSTSESKHLLIGYERSRVYRHSSLAYYCVLYYKKEECRPVSVHKNPTNIKLQYANWLPKTDKLVFVYDNNIYIRDYSGSEDVIQITNDGIPGIIYNGIPDWVYEEEILGTDNALYFTKKESKIAFARFNDKKVENFYYTVYGPPSDPFHNQYPSNVMIKYPKAGTNNPIVTLKVYDLSKNLTLPVNPPPEVLAYGDYIFTATTWITDDKLSIIWMNRKQTKSVISECLENQKQEYDCKKREIVEETKGWVDLFQPPMYSNDGSEFLQIRPPSPTKKKDLRYNHIFHSEKKQLTSGNFVVVSILHWKDSLIYFIGTRPGYPGERHLYSVSLDKDIKCITCYTECQYVSASFGESMYIQKCSSPIKIPVVTLRSIQSHELIATIEDNSELQDLLTNKSLPKRWDLMEPVGEDKKFYAPVSLLLPLDFDKNKKYPTLVYVYGGPGSQEVSYAWNSPAWPEYLVTSRNIIYMIIDGRGTGFQSVDYQFANYHALGTLEIQDQIQVTQSVQKKFSFIDKKRTGIWGWSYGGYVTLMTLIQDKKNVFSCGISVAPPTDWLFYDSVYTERYMGLPTPEKEGGNKRGYERASVLRSVESLRNKTLLINHGTADDNVHYQQSMMFIREMEQRNVDFEEFTYPDENHALGGVSRFLYHHMDKFLGKCFGYKV